MNGAPHKVAYLCWNLLIYKSLKDYKLYNNIGT